MHKRKRRWWSEALGYLVIFGVALFVCAVALFAALFNHHEQKWRNRTRARNHWNKKVV